MSEDDDGDEVEEDEDEDEDEDENNDLEEDDVQMMHPDTDHDDHEIDEVVAITFLAEHFFSEDAKSLFPSMTNRLGRANDHGVNPEHPLLEEPSSFLVHRRHSENTVDMAFSERRHDSNSSRLDAIFEHCGVEDMVIVSACGWMIAIIVATLVCLSARRHGGVASIPAEASHSRSTLKSG
ncbi:hypothetical protein IEQ34_021405 [Dendrobium chrysotoxum]|uniref:Transmembrane protein n=1 Tax=Dendrobium chrysotoxum TaxID=161865 RepID=A0AAV7G4X2_DENCH|nr:hypothetical protein IEQ34_021405 [Dendrobium chrysotoxum]